MFLTISAVRQKTGISLPTLRLYADSGLVPCQRDSAGHRLFDEDAPEIALRVRKERMKQFRYQQHEQKKSD